ncbi:MAG: Hsp20/alpha crystallin family protein [Patescibacteria group bacterium]|nr:Hsp20/alpha crystallin family protein [Patescibacteria group bacterium]MBU1877142.1 Hsp20/alpha crystallin family protein [Patescibacteria group bacterium]
MVNSFLEKLKKGMGIEIPEEEVKEKIKSKKRKPIEKKIKRVVIREEKEEIEEEIEKPEELMVVEQLENENIEEVNNIQEPIEPKVNKKIILKAKKMGPDEIQEEKEDWLVPEGQLSVDVYQTKEELVIQSAIAGIKPDSLDISIEGDVVAIKGKREKPNNEEGDYFTQECYWGQFSREIILPVEVDPNRVKAAMKDGILIIRIPKIFREKKRKILVKRLNE